jgi:hypothetical protein
MSRRLRIPELTRYERADLSDLPRVELEDLAWRFRELLRSLANRLGEDSTTSSRPPSSNDPYRHRRGTSGERREGEMKWRGESRIAERWAQSTSAIFSSNASSRRSR